MKGFRDEAKGEDSEAKQDGAGLPLSKSVRGFDSRRSASCSASDLPHPALPLNPFEFISAGFVFGE